MQHQYNINVMRDHDVGRVKKKRHASCSHGQFWMQLHDTPTSIQEVS